MKYCILAMLSVVLLQAHPSYTAYSGAAGSKGYCASSCHGSTSGGTITMTGIPQTYVPLTTYTVTVKHTGGSMISNFNASSRIGTTTAAAGSFAAGTNTALYSVAGYESGVRASVNNIDSAVFKWTAPAAGTGEVKIYLSGLQGTKSGASSKLAISTTELVTGVAGTKDPAGSFELDQNYPNPFNPATMIRYRVPYADYVSLKVFDILGNEVASLADERKEAGTYHAAWRARGLSSGIYYYSLRMNGLTLTKKMMILK